VIKKGEGRGLLQIAATFEAEIINIAECLNAKCAEERCVNIVKSHEISKLNMNSTIKVATKFVGELNQLNENSDTKKEGIQHIKSKIRRVLKEKMGKQSNAWPVY
jgi:hypothetical protein